ncbi:hypothetical protein [Nonomuraea sp. NPDC049625]|uniref:hypothetical protein n=1 Tax=Nonomuraea sp. NPDC049625 TaxID=3155775 RepID=UPI00341DE63A
MDARPIPAPGCRDGQLREPSVPALAYVTPQSVSLTMRFDLVLVTAGTLPIKAARTLLKPGGRIISIAL